MRRRRFLQGVATIPAVPVLLAQRTVEEVPKIEATVPDAVGDTAARFFTGPQLAALRKLSDIVMPAIGETPGALDAHAPEFLDFLIGDSPPDRQRLYRAGLDALNANSARKFSRPFAQLGAAEADSILAPLRETWTYDPPNNALAAFLRAAKADILTATVNSREWIAVVSKRTRNAGGTGIYWHYIE